jgi:serine/threonine protein kinase
LVGSILGNRYRILREIGSGGMAKVYLAEDITGNDLVAVKVLYPQFSQDISFIQRFNREAKLASTLTDPHIVRVLDYGADRDLQYLVMEYVEGQDLHAKLKEEGTFEWKYALETLDQLATALEHAHLHGVVHRDIKPQNLMLNDNGLLKVLDFGIARIPTLPSLTQSGFIGSPYYASPEQAMGEEVDIRSDIYSAGIVLYELLSGNIPFDAKSPWSIISQHITSEPPPIELPEGEIPEDVRQIINRMLAKRPEERFQTPTAVRQAIATILTGQPALDNARDTQPIPHSDKSALIDSLNHRATKAINTQEWARAADLLSQAARLDPHNQDIAEKLAMAERQTRLDSLYKSGSRAIDQGRWEEATHHLNVIVELDPEYKDSTALLAKAHEALKTENAQQFIAMRYKEGLAYLETERWPEAIEVLTEVQRLAPGYERVDQLLVEAKQRSYSPWIQRLAQSIRQNSSKDLWRWGLITAGIAIIAFLSFLVFGPNNQASGDNDIKQRLKTLYEEAQLAINRGNTQEAIIKLEQILNEDPDYADVAVLRRELLATPTPTLTPTPIPTPVAATPTPETDPVAEMVDQAQDAIVIGLWTEAIDTLADIRSINTKYETALVSSLLCDAYVGRGLENLANIRSQTQEKDEIKLALADFEAGVAECPRRVDLTDQAERAKAYLKALETSKSDYETLIPLLTPIVAASPDYAGGNAKELLYQAYLSRAKTRQESPELIAAALGDYEAALALNVDDPSQAQTERAELLLSFSQPTQPTPTPTQATVSGNNQPKATPTPKREPTPTEPVRIKFRQPVLISPADDTVFAGKYAEVFLEWEPVRELARDEYYDVTIMHLFADQPRYTGSLRTRETRVQISADIGVGEAGGDRFYWWVTVRKDGTAPSPNELDLPLSPRSEAKTFIWSP